MPPAYQSILLVTGAFLLYAGLLTAADVLGADFDDFPPTGALLWTSLVLGGARCCGRRSSATARSACCWPRSSAASRCCRRGTSSSTRPRPRRTAGCWPPTRRSSCSRALALREPARRHAEVLIDAGGLAIAAIAVSSLELLRHRRRLAARASGRSCCSARASGWSPSARSTARPGPAYLGVVNLGLFILVVADSGDETLFWWPLVLLVIGARDARSPACARAARSRPSPTRTAPARRRWPPAPTRTRS